MSLFRQHLTSPVTLNILESSATTVYSYNGIITPLLVVIIHDIVYYIAIYAWKKMYKKLYKIILPYIYNTLARVIFAHARYRHYCGCGQTTLQ